MTRSTGPLPPAIGPYVISEKIGSGGMATVYRASHPDGHQVALKVLAIHLTDNEPMRKRFERESHALQQLRHPHILPVEDSGEEGGRPYLVMRLMGERSLDDLLQQGPLPVTDVARYTRQIASALDFAHSKGIIHRDIKPENILLDDDDRPYLADFGVAYFVTTEKGERLTTAGEFLGTPAYASPEQCRGEVDKIDRTSDTYSLAVMVFEMATGRLPFEAPSPLAVIKKHLYEPPPNPLEFNPRLTQKFYAVIVKGMAKLPQARYLSAMKFSEAVDESFGLHVIPQADSDDNWLHGDTAPVSPDWSPAPPEPPPAADPLPVLESDTPFRPEADDPGGPDDPFEGIPPAPDDVTADFDDHFEPDTIFDEDGGGSAEPSDDFPPFEAVMDSESAPPPTEEPAPGTTPVIHPIGPTPAITPRRRAPWMQVGVYATIAISVAAIMLGAIIAYTRFFLPSVSLNATYRSAPVGVTFKYPDGWTVSSGSLAILSDQAAPVVILSDRPVPPSGPYGAARLVIAVQRVDPVSVFHVPSNCQGIIPSGPQRTFECLDRQHYLTPVYQKFNTAHTRGVKLPGTLPPQRASLPVILLSTNSPRWIAVIIVYWNGYDDARDVWERMAKSLHEN